jgi:hypothetical protein
MEPQDKGTCRSFFTMPFPIPNTRPNCLMRIPLLSRILKSVVSSVSAGRYVGFSGEIPQRLIN